MIQIRFSFELPYSVFSDALYLPEDHSFTEEQIEEMKQERLRNWVALNGPFLDATSTQEE